MGGIRRSSPLGKRRAIGAGPEMGTDSETARATRTTAALAAALEPGADTQCVCRLGGVAAHGGGDLAVSCVLSPETTQRIDHRAPRNGGHLSG